MNHYTNVEEDYEYLEANEWISNSKLSSFVCPCCKDKQVITKDYNNEFVTKLKSESLFSNMRSNTSVPNHVESTQQHKHLKLEILVSIKEGWYKNKNHSSNKRKRVIILSATISLGMNIEK
jgi:hypothetical protein